MLRQCTVCGNIADFENICPCCGSDFNFVPAEQRQAINNQNNFTYGNFPYEQNAYEQNTYPQNTYEQNTYQYQQYQPTNNPVNIQPDYLASNSNIKPVKQKTFNKNKFVKMAIISVLAVIFAIEGGFLFSRVVCQEIKYKSAIHLIKKGDYEEGRQKLKEIYTYKDAKYQYQKSCITEIEQLLDQNEIEAASELAMDTYGYDDASKSAIGKAICENAIQYIKEENYKKAYELLCLLESRSGKISETESQFLNTTIDTLLKDLNIYGYYYNYLSDDDEQKRDLVKQALKITDISSDSKKLCDKYKELSEYFESQGDLVSELMTILVIYDIDDSYFSKDEIIKYFEPLYKLCFNINDDQEAIPDAWNKFTTLYKRTTYHEEHHGDGGEERVQALFLDINDYYCDKFYNDVQDGSYIEDISYIINDTKNRSRGLEKNGDLYMKNNLAEAYSSYNKALEEDQTNTSAKEKLKLCLVEMIKQTKVGKGTTGDKTFYVVDKNEKKGIYTIAFKYKYSDLTSEESYIHYSEEPNTPWYKSALRTAVNSEKYLKTVFPEGFTDYIIKQDDDYLTLITKKQNKMYRSYFLNETDDYLCMDNDTKLPSNYSTYYDKYSEIKDKRYYNAYLVFKVDLSK